MAQFLRLIVQLILLQDRIICRRLTHLLVVTHGDFFAIIIKKKSLPAGVESHNGLLCLQVFELNSGIFVGGCIQSILIGNAVKSPISFCLLSLLNELIGLLQCNGSLFCFELSRTAGFGQIGLTIIRTLIGPSNQFEISIVVSQLKTLWSDHTPCNIFQRHIELWTFEFQVSQATAGYCVDKSDIRGSVVHTWQNIKLPCIRFTANTNRINTFTIDKDTEYFSALWQTDSQTAALNDFHSDIHRRQLITFG